MLKIFYDKTRTVGIMPKIQMKLYKNGRYVNFSCVSVLFNMCNVRFNSGAPTQAAEQGPKLTDCAIQNAIQDWDDKSESEFSDSCNIKEDE